MTDDMTLEYACKLLSVHPSDNHEQLRTRYRTLMKKYHPDQYRENQEFYTIITRRITHAYQLLSEHVAQRERDTAQHNRTSTQPTRTEPEDQRPQAQPHHASRNRHAPLQIDPQYRPYLETVHEAICHYYSYNLSNVYLRDSGNTRTHFRAVQNKLTTVLKKFKRHIINSDDEQTDVYRYFLFCTAFFNNIQSELRIQTTLNKTAHRLLRVYRECTRILDNAIAARYCGHDSAGTPTTDQLLLVRHNFRELAAEDKTLGFCEAATVKYTLADALLNALSWQYR